jgi:chromosome segregation ATPase
MSLGPIHQAAPARPGPSLGVIRDQLAAIDARLRSVESLASEIQGLRRGVREQLEQTTTRLHARERGAARLGERVRTLDERLGAVEGLAAEVQALRRASREQGEEAAGREARTRQHLGGIEQRLAAVESKLADVGPVAAELQAVRRGARHDAERLAAELEARDGGLRSLVGSELGRVGEESEARARALEAVGDQLAALEARLAPVESLGIEVAAIRRGVGHELELAADRLAERTGEVEQRIETFEARVVEAARLRGEVESVAAHARSHDGSVARLVDGLTALRDRLVALERLGADVERGAVVLGEVRAAEHRATETLAQLTARVGALETWAARASRGRRTPPPAEEGSPGPAQP